MEATGIVYGLLDPRDGALRYVGQTAVTAEKRFKGHLCDRSASRKCLWIAELAALKLIPQLLVLGQFPLADIDVEERSMIALVRSTGAILHNTAAGGGARVDRNDPAVIAARQRRLERAKYWAEMDGTDPPEDYPEVQIKPFTGDVWDLICPPPDPKDPYDDGCPPVDEWTKEDEERFANEVISDWEGWYGGKFERPRRNDTIEQHKYAMREEE